MWDSILGPPGDGGPHVFVASVETPELDHDDHHHLARSLRLRPGDPLTVSDGRGAWRSCRFGDRLVIDGEVYRVPRPAPELRVGFALTKGAKPELVVQKLTELGIDHIQPFVAEHSVARWDEAKAARQHERLGRIAREAAMQSRRVWLPEVDALADFATLAIAPAVRAERGGEPLDAHHVCVLVGPEGGWSAGERASLGEVGLGHQVLRAETAAIAAGVLLAHTHRGTRS